MSVNPRACGADPRTQCGQSNGGATGQSPRVRGGPKCTTRRPRILFTGPIPARAGRTHATHGQRPWSKVNPRACGADLLTYDGMNLRQTHRPIPARAGRTLCLHMLVPCRDIRANPRACGADQAVSTRHLAKSLTYGQSPRVAGRTLGKLS